MIAVPDGTVEIMVKFSDRLKAAMAYANMKTGDLARALGVSYQAVKRTEDGLTKSFTARNNAKAAKILGVDADWLAAGTTATVEPAKISSEFDTNVGEASLGSGVRIPLISAVQAGMWRDIVDSFQAGDAHDWLMTDQRVSASTFALEISGDSMEPEFKAGDRVIIDPDLTPLPGDFVVAKNGEDEATFKKYRPRGIGEDGAEVFELVPLNDDYPSIRSDQQPTRIVGTMIEHRKYRRRR
jgi:SOS-response transcriptional repressor LexA